jgi:hypothetical protein
MNSCLTLSSYSRHQIVIIVAIIYYTIEISIAMVTFIFLIFCDFCMLHPPFKFSSLRYRDLGLLRTCIRACIFVEKHNLR